MLMRYIKATENDLDEIVELVQDTIRTIYPKYYPKEVVDFFCEHHCKENILRDIQEGSVGIIQQENVIVGTGCYKENHITRVYVRPEYQGQGYGSCIMQCLENTIAEKYDTVYLDASLPACRIYENRGYKTVKHDRWNVENGVVLVYEVMEKVLPHVPTDICYEGKYFSPRINTENGEVDGNTVFEYHQKNNMLWADYSGGEIIKGHLIGTVAQNGELDFYYHHVNEQNQIRVGVCHSVPHILENGKTELWEEWQWLNGDKSKGSSVVCEVDKKEQSE